MIILFLAKIFIFLKALIGDRLNRMPIPTRLNEELYLNYMINPARSSLTDDEIQLLEKWYTKQLPTNDQKNQSHTNYPQQNSSKYSYYILRQDYR